MIQLKKQTQNAICLIFLLALSTFFTPQTQAQTDCPLGQLDTSFYPGTGANNNVWRTVIQPDGKIIIAGEFTSYDGTNRNRIARLNSDGTLDASFDPGTGFDNWINALVLQPDGKIICAGDFSTFNGTARPRIVRLNANGSFDNTFNPGTGFDYWVNGLVRQTDGKLIATGHFGAYNGVSRTRIVRINTNGSIDLTFDPGTGFDNYPEYNAVVLQTDGKIIAGGNFTSYDGNARNRIVRINTNGSIDNSFNPGSGFDNTVWAIGIKSNGKILVGGAFNQFDGNIRDRIAQLNTNGTLDNGFDPQSGFNSFVRSILIQSNNKAIVAGEFTAYYNGSQLNRVCRINDDGSPDISLFPEAGFNTTVFGITQQNDASLITWGGFTSFRNISRNYIARIGLNLVVGDITQASPYCAGQSINIGFYGGTGCFNSGNVFSAQLSPDGIFSNPITIGTLTATGGGTINATIPNNISGSNYRIRIVSSNPVIEGDAFGFNSSISINNTAVNVIANPGFSITPGTSVTFTANPSNGGSSPSYQWFRNSTPVGTGTSYTSSSLANGDTIYCRMTGNACASNAIVNSNKTVMYVNSNQNPYCLGGQSDATFNAGTALNGLIRTMARQPDGKILIGGDFTLYNSTSRNYIARLNTDGTLDNTFNPGSGFNGLVWSIELQPDGKIFVGGEFTAFNGTTRNYMVRLNANGSFDNTFNIGIGFSYLVYDIALQPDGKVIVGGEFGLINGISRVRIARLNSNGSLDYSFNPGTGPNNYIHPNSIALQNDGKIIIGGSFTNYSGVNRNRIARLNADGSIDTSFDPGSGFDNIVLKTLLQPDGKVLVGGQFNNFDGNIRNAIARLNANGTIDNNFDPLAGFNGDVRALLLQPDGKVLAGGSFTTFYNGSTANRVIRINNNGSLDGSFDAFNGYNSTVYSFASENNSKLLVAGQFTDFNGSTVNYINRLDKGVSISSISPAGPYCAGQTITVNYAAGTACFNAGNTFTLQLSPDASFNSPVNIGTVTATGSGSITATLPQISGNSYRLRIVSSNPAVVSNPLGVNAQIVVNNTAVNVLVNPSYAIAPGTSVTFTAAPFNGGNAPTYQWFNNGIQVGTGVTYTSSTLANNDSIYCRMTGNACASNAIINSNPVVMSVGTPSNACIGGALDQSFTVGTGFNSLIYCVLEQPDGKVLVGGRFTSFNGNSANRLCRLNANGTIDPTFNIGTGFDETVYDMVLLPNGKIIVVGYFTAFNGISRNRIIGLNADGTFDASFNAGSGFNSFATSIKIQSTGKLIVAGYFSVYNGVSRSAIIRLNTDGSVDESFSSSTSLFNNGIELHSLDFQPDGKIIVAGTFTEVNGVTRNRIARLNVDGTLDTSFDPGTGLNDMCIAVKVCPDGKIFAGGVFTNFNGTAINRLVRLNSNGTIDNTFNIGAGFNDLIWDIEIDSNNKILVSGRYTLFNNASYNRITSLNNDGSVNNNSFSFNSGFSGALYSNSDVIQIVFSQGNSIFVVGDFTQYNTSTIHSIAKILPINTTISNLSPTGPYCAGQQVWVNFNAGNGCFNSGNIFTAQLSNNAGSFATPTNIGTFTGVGTGADSMLVTIPSGLSGTGYRIRIIASNPAVFGMDNGVDFTINSGNPPTVTSSTPNARCGTGTVSLSAVPSSGAQIRWFDVATGGTSLATGNNFTTPSISVSTTYYAEAFSGSCTSARVAVLATVNPTPVIINTIAASRCGAGALTLFAEADTGVVRWYSTATGGTILFTGTTFTTPVINSTTNYYAEGNLGTCNTTPRVLVVATINAGTSPTITNTVQAQKCGPGILTLQATASAGVVEWYDAQVGGNLLGTGNTYTTPVISVTTNYYAQAVNGICVNPNRTLVTASILAGQDPSITSSLPAARCGEGILTLEATASAGIVNWYTTATGGTVIATGSPFNTPFITATTDYYAEALDGVCISATRTLVTATINTIPTITNVTPGYACSISSVNISATASAGNVVWYDAPTGGTALFTGNNFTTPILTVTTDYYAEAVDASCNSVSRSLVTASIYDTIPVITSTIPASRCGTGSVTLAAFSNTGTVNWYTSATGGTSVYTGNYFTTPSIAATTDYYAEAANGPCLASTRVLVTATVIPGVPPSITAVVNDSVCSSGILNLSATASSGNISWFDAPVGGNLITTGNTYTTPLLNATTSYYVETDNGVCTSTPRTQVTAVVTPFPIIATTVPAAVCGANSVDLTATYTNGVAHWYDSPGGTLLFIGNTYSTPTISNSNTYYVQGVDNGCVSAINTPITATVFQLPVPVITQTGAVTCLGANINLNANAGYVSYAWYKEGSANVLANTASYGTTTSADYYVLVTDTNGCSDTSAVYALNYSYLTPAPPCLSKVVYDCNATYAHNILLIWEKPVTDAISAYKILRESVAANVYDTIATVPYSALSEYVDLNFTALRNPENQTFRYKLVIVDTCGNKTLPSNYHETMLLLFTDGPTSHVLQWNNYVGSTYSSFNIMRAYESCNDTTNWVEIGQISASCSPCNFPINNPPTDTVLYRIEIDFSDPCESTRANYSKSKSNVGNNQIIPTVGIKEKDAAYFAATLIPNPSDGNTILQWESLKAQNLQITLTDVVGKIVLADKINAQKGSNKYNIEVDTAGVYFVTIFDANGSKNVLKMVVR
jgi:uncharacterized delta-60 repeat protein